MNDIAEKDIRKTLVKGYKEMKKNVKTALEVAGFEVEYMSCTLAIKDGYFMTLNIKRKEVK